MTQVLQDVNESVESMCLKQCRRAFNFLKHWATHWTDLTELFRGRYNPACSKLYTFFMYKIRLNTTSHTFMWVVYITGVEGNLISRNR